jgi:rhodanese-related sulfurtransferase
MLNISVQDLKKLGDSINLIDIRSSIKYIDNHIMSAKNIDSKLLINNPSKYLDKNTKYYIYCQRGITSSRVCNYLYNMGYNVVNIIGGYEAWILEN